jgi:hypothetical protein
MAAKQVDILIEQGATFVQEVELKINDELLDLTNVIIRGQIRRAFNDALPTETFTCVKTDITGGKFTFGLLASETTLLIPATYLYDIEVELQDGTVFRVLQGKAKVSAEVTK